MWSACADEFLKIAAAQREKPFDQLVKQLCERGARTPHNLAGWLHAQKCQRLVEKRATEWDDPQKREYTNVPLRLLDDVGPFKDTQKEYAGALYRALSKSLLRGGTYSFYFPTGTKPMRVGATMSANGVKSVADTVAAVSFTPRGYGRLVAMRVDRRPGKKVYGPIPDTKQASGTL